MVAARKTVRLPDPSAPVPVFRPGCEGEDAASWKKERLIAQRESDGVFRHGNNVPKSAFSREEGTILGALQQFAVTSATLRTLRDSNDGRIVSCDYQGDKWYRATAGI